MKTIRRVYFYSVAVISLELLIWGVINLLRSIINPGAIGNTAQSLSVGLAQVIVSIPIFLIHWMVIQKDAVRTEEEHTSLIRAMFLYGILLGTLIPVIQNILALVNRLVLDAGRISRMTALIGRSQTLSDNLIAIVINLLMAWYFVSILKGDWKVSVNRANLIDLRRVHRYFWMLYGLGMTVTGVVLIIQFILRKQADIMTDQLAGLINPSTLLILGVPIWVYSWNTIQKGIDVPDERNSLWRRGILFSLVFAGAITTMVCSIGILGQLLDYLLGKEGSLQDLMGAIRANVSILVPMSVIWIYYFRHLKFDITQLLDSFWQQALVRVYRYLLAFLGLAATLTGLIGLLRFVIRMFLQSGNIYQNNISQIAQNLSILSIGLIYWLVFFLPENRMALCDSEDAEHARRSLTRKIYLYAIIFGGVVGVMASAGSTLYMLLEGILSGGLSEKITEILWGTSQFVVFSSFLTYHLVNLRRDARALSKSLEEKHAGFPVKIICPPDQILEKELVLAFSRHAPAIPVRFVQMGEISEESIAHDGAVIIPSTMLTQPDGEGNRVLAGYSGKVIVIPETSDRWIWIPLPGKINDLAKTVALEVRSLAEGRFSQQSRKSTPGWLVALYILGGLISLQLLLSLVGGVLSGF